MKKTIFCDVTSAEDNIFVGDVNMVIASAVEGDIGIYPGHVPFLSMLKSGPVNIICTDNTEKIFHLSGGFIEVQPKSVYILADSAISSDDINELEVIKAKKNAEELLKNKTSKVEYSKVASQLAELTARIKTLQSINKYRKS